MTYRELLALATHTVAGDTHGANRWLLHLAAVLKDQPLLPHERAYLYRLRRIWKRRAAGQDARWNEFGSMPGAKPRPRPRAVPAPAVPRRSPVSAPVATPAAPTALPPKSPEVPKPALSSLLEKYGRP